MEKKLTREELLSKLQEIGEEQSKLKVQLDAINFEEKSAEINANLGKCFMESRRDKEFVSCVWLCEISDDKNSFNTIRISYWKDCDFYFTIENATIYFSELNHKDEYKEITKEKFHFHYNEANKRKDYLFNLGNLTKK